MSQPEGDDFVRKENKSLWWFKMKQTVKQIIN